MNGVEIVGCIRNEPNARIQKENTDVRCIIALIQIRVVVDGAAADRVVVVTNRECNDKFRERK